MSTSTDGLLFYGYHLSDDFEIPEEAADTFLMEDEPVQLGYHCSYEYEMGYVFWAASSTTARRGYPEAVSPSSMSALDTAQADEAILAFAERFNLPKPGEAPNEDWPENKASDLGWWLASWWG